jgi:hypothetical protein
MERELAFARKIVNNKEKTTNSITTVSALIVTSVRCRKRMG